MTSIEAGLDLEIGASLKILTDAEADRARRAQEEERLIPVDAQIHSGTEIEAGAGFGLVNCGGPAMGRAWVLRRLAIALLTPMQAAAGTAYWFASASEEVSLLQTTGWFAQMAALPSVAFFTSRQVVLRYPQKVICYIDGPTAGDTYIIAGYALDEMADQPAAARYSL